MRKVICESFSDVEGFLTSRELKDLLADEFEDIKGNPEAVDSAVCNFIVDVVAERFPQEDTKNLLSVTQVVVIKVIDSQADIVGTHNVIRYNGMFYDYTAHQFSEEFSNLITYRNVPVVQSVIKSDRQLSQSVSTLRSYAMLEYNGGGIDDELDVES